MFVFFFSDDPLLMTVVPASLKFEVSKASSAHFKKAIILNGQINRVDKPIFSVPTFSIDEQMNEKVIESDIYIILDYYGCHLSAEFQLLRNIVIGKKGLLYIINQIWRRE